MRSIRAGNAFGEGIAALEAAMRVMGGYMFGRTPCDLLRD